VSDSISELFARYPLLRECEADLIAALEILISAYGAGNKLLICGNGGSAADCEHIVGELMKGFELPRRIPEEHAKKLADVDAAGAQIGAQLQGALPAISLVSHVSLTTALANDTSDEMIFAQQVYAYGQAGDVLLSISTSGNSKNVIAAVVTGKAFGLRSLALTGRSGGRLAPIVDVAIKAPADRVAEIQELHLPIYHWLCIELEQRFFGKSAAE
jgi:phosphoheptose isomerase